MTKAEASVMIDRPTETVWSFVFSDLDRFAKTLNPDVIESKQTSAGPIGVGTTFHETRSKTPKAIDYRMTEYEPKSMFTIAMTSGPINGSRFTMRLENIEGKTRLTTGGDYHFSGFYKLLQPFMGRPGQFRKEGEAQIGRMKRAVESEAKP
ncbi:MAG TPA: SRPBCC family protein [Nitrososphaerales archaeon]|nr:SRPBCC family protein [Nitrososphaerales archaeon]